MIEQIIKYLDPKWNYIIVKKAIDDVEDDFWACAETLNEAIDIIESETEAYNNSPEFQFDYREIMR